MSISVDLNIYNTRSLVDGLKAVGANDDDLLDGILSSCGTFLGDSYIIMNNEAYEDGNPAYRVDDLINHAFKIDLWSSNFDWMAHRTGTGISYVEVWEVANDLGINMEDDE